MDVINNRLIRRAIPLFNALAMVLLILALAFILHAGKEVFIPIAVSILLSFALSPVVTWLQGAGLPKGIAVLGAVVMGLALIGSEAVWWAYPAGSIAALILTWAAYRYGGWRRRQGAALASD